LATREIVRHRKAGSIVVPIWYFGRDSASRLSGWVPDCYLDGEPN
jgi:hypothetical protein